MAIRTKSTSKKASIKRASAPREAVDDTTPVPEAENVSTGDVAAPAFKQNTLNGTLLPIDDQGLTAEQLDDLTAEEWAGFGYFSPDDVADKKRQLQDRLQ